MYCAALNSHLYGLHMGLIMYTANMSFNHTATYCELQECQLWAATPKGQLETRKRGNGNGKECPKQKSILAVPHEGRATRLSRSSCPSTTDWYINVCVYSYLLLVKTHKPGCSLSRDWELGLCTVVWRSRPQRLSSGWSSCVGIIKPTGRTNDCTVVCP